MVRVSRARARVAASTSSPLACLLRLLCALAFAHQPPALSRLHLIPIYLPTHALTHLHAFTRYHPPPPAPFAPPPCPSPLPPPFPFATPPNAFVLFISCFFAPSPAIHSLRTSPHAPAPLQPRSTSPARCTTGTASGTPQAGTEHLQPAHTAGASSNLQAAHSSPLSP
jgi:hypothetical protein